MTEDELYTEFILVLGRALKELADDQHDIATSDEALDGDKEIAAVIDALPDVLKKHRVVLDELYEVYKDARLKG